MIELKHLTKKYDHFLAVEDLNLKIETGEFFGLLGPNGAGKTTTIGMLSTLLLPTSGEIWINGELLTRQKNQLKQKLSVVTQEYSMRQDMTMNEIMEYQGRLYTERKLTYEIFSEESSLIKSLVIEIENNASWKNSVFKKTSELVCEKIYRIFKEVYSCETRVSIEYIFDKPVNQTKKIEQHVKMSGRRSSQRSTVKKAIPIDRKSKYYSYQIFKDNNRGINILSKDKIDDATIWYKNPQNNIDIKQYIGIAVSALDETKVDFIFQIDFLDEFKFGEDNSDKDIQKFIEKYFMSYINIVTLAYLLNLNNKKEIGEV